MYCKTCGSENDDGARFCRDCGRAMTGSPPTAGSVAPVHSGDTPDAIEASPKARTWMWVAGGAGLVVVLFFVGLTVLLFAAQPTFTPQPTYTLVPSATLSGPSNVRYVYRDRHGQVVYSGFAESVRVSWEPVEGVDYYKIYARAWMFDDRGPLCDPDYFCRMVIANLEETTHEFESPANLISGSDGINRHWVTACNRSGCSDLVLAVVQDSSPSTTAPTASPSPEQSGTPTESDMAGGSQPVATIGSVATPPATATTTATASLKATPNHAAQPTFTPQPTYTLVPSATLSGPSNVRYVYRDRHGQVVYSGFAESVRVSWEPVEGVDYYKIYARAWMFDDRGPLCDPDYFCRMVIANLEETTHEFESPANLISGSDGINRHWVTACNRSGCSDLVLAVVQDSSPSTTAPTASPSSEQSGTPTESDMSRRSFEASTPPGYTRVTLTDRGTVWGTPERFTTDSSLGAVAYMLLGSVRGCSFANEELKRSSIVYTKGERLGRLPTYESEEICGKTSSTWDTDWDGLRIARLRIFDESSSTNVREYVYDPVGGQYVESPAATGGSN